MKKIVSFEQFNPADFQNDHVGMWAAHLGMSREEYVAHYASPTIGSGIDEAVKVETERYYRSHLKQPKGYGKWMFSYNSNGDEPFEVPGSMSYSEATKWVKAKAKEDGQDYVYVMEANDHEVGMAQGQLEAIHKAAAELQEKIGGEEKDLPGWIQSHITSAYEYLKQANDNFHELEEAEETNEALKMLMDPLMVKIMKQFGFKSDPGIKAELREEIRAAVEEVLKKHDIIVEGTFNDGEIAIYGGDEDNGEMHIFKRGKGYYGYNDSWDFEAKDKKELEKKLKGWHYDQLLAGSID